jgi:hypothetical protein
MNSLERISQNRRTLRSLFPFALPNRLLATLLFAISLPTILPAQQPTPSVTPSDTKQNGPADVIQIINGNPVELGSTVRLVVRGALAKEIATALTNNPGAAAEHLQLYLNGYLIVGLVPVIIHLTTKSEEQQNQVYEVDYHLTRISNDDTNRKAWDSFLPSIPFGEQKLRVGVGYLGQVSYVTPNEALPFRVRSPLEITLVIIGGLLLFSLSLVVVLRSSMVREAGTNTAFSLGKSQMAFWGLLVAFCFLGVWIVSRRMERIPLQTLILIGISSATGLSSVLISQGKRSDAQIKKTKLESDKANLAAETEPLLQKKIANSQAQQTPESQAQGVVIDKQLNDFSARRSELDQALSDQTLRAKPPKTSGKWFVDVISDANGPSFYRFQVVLWTLILGIVFIWSVANEFSMPEFDTTLLILMGISNGTYLGFKIPENQ